MERKLSQDFAKTSMTSALDSLRNGPAEIAHQMKIFDQENAVIHAIFKERIRQGLSQRDLAELSGIKQPMIDRIERMECSPRIDTIAKLLIALDLELTVKPRKQVKKASPVQRVEPNKEVSSK